MKQPSPKPATGSSTHPEYLVAGIASFCSLLLLGVGLRTVLPHGHSQIPLMPTCASALAAMLVLAMTLAANCRSWTMQLASELYSSDPNKGQKLRALRHTSSKFIFYGLVGIYGVLVYKVAFTAGSIGDLITGWLQCSAIDANISPAHLVAHASHRAVQFLYYVFPNPLIGELVRFRLNIFENLGLVCKWLVLSALFFMTWKPCLRAAAILTSCSERITSDRGGAFYDALIAAIKQRAFTITISAKNPFMDNCRKSMCWLVFCYSVLFSLIAFCPGDLGVAIRNWLTHSMMSAYNFSLSSDEMAQLFPFLASIIAMYAAVPFAIMTGAFLPPPRAAELRLTADWILFPQCHLVPLKFQLLRSTDDVSQVVLKENTRRRDLSDLTVEFKDGGQFAIRLGQIPAVQVHKMLSTIDENSPDAHLDRASLALLSHLSKLPDVRYERRQGTAESNSESHRFASTTFSLHCAGESILDEQYRVVKLLSCKSHTATYLVRNRHNQLELMKQYFLTDSASDAVPDSVNESEPNSKTHSIETEVTEEQTAQGDSVASAWACPTSEMIETLNRLKQSGVVCPHNILRTVDSSYLFFEYIKGTDINSYIKEHGPQESHLVIKWATQIADMLRQLHDSIPAIAHKRVCPSNLMVDEVGNLRLIGFALRQTMIKSQASFLVGNQSFHAPETLANVHTPSGDIYSFGATIAYLLTGEYPRPFCSSDLTLENVDCPQFLIALVKKCTAVDPDERFASFREILELLERENGKAQSHQDRQAWLARSTSPDQLASIYQGSTSSANSVSDLLKKLSDSASGTAATVGGKAGEIKIGMRSEEKAEAIEAQSNEQLFEYVIRTKKEKLQSRNSEES
jgi:serine/threonine protein kinase